MIRCAEAVQPAVLLDHLSWSSVQTYRGCPRCFELRYVDRVPAERSSSTLIFGTAIHAAIEAIHVARMEGKAKPTEKELMSVFDSSWNEGVNRAPEIAFAKNETTASLRALAERMLAAYLEQLHDDAEVIGVEMEFRFKLLPELPEVIGKIDLAERKGDALVLTDFKTSKNSWNETKLSEGLPQLVLYACACLPTLERLGLNCIKPQFCVLTKGKNPKVQKMAPEEVGRADVERLRKMFSETYGYIERGWFPPIESWRCSSCPYRVRCQGR